MTEDSGKVLVTGASGFVARYCIAQLLEQGWHVRATVRDLEKASQIDTDLAAYKRPGAKLDFVQAELNRDAGWDEAVTGCLYVLHVASPLPATYPKDDQELIRPALGGTLRVLRAAAKAGVERVVITSSSAAVNYGRGGSTVAATEADWSTPNPDDTTSYERSKIAAEIGAWEWKKANPEGPEIVTICPSAVIGPVMSEVFSNSIQIIAKMIDGSLPGVPRLGFSLVDVRDLADLHVRALTAKVAANQRYIGSGSFLMMEDIAAVIRQNFPDISKVPTLKLPDWLVRLSSLFDKALRSRIFELGITRPLSSQKAAEQLGWRPRSTEQSIIDTVVSLQRLKASVH